MTNVDKVNQKPVTPAQNTAKPIKTENAPNSIMDAAAKTGKKAAPEFMTIGGVKFNSADVVEFCESPISEAHGSGQGKRTYEDAIKYEVTLKDGTKMTWTSGLSRDKANLESKAEVVFEKDGTINFKGLNGVKITDTPNDDKYRLLGCRHTKIEAARSKEKALGFLDNLQKKLGGFVKKEYEGTDNDNITIGDRELPDGKIQKSFDNSVRANNGDTVNDKKVDTEFAKNYGAEAVHEDDLEEDKK